MKTIIWNATEISLWEKEGWIEPRINLKAPRWANLEWTAKFSSLDTPSWIFINNTETVYFLDKISHNNNWELIWKLNKYSWNNSNLDWDWEINFLENSSVKLLNLEKIIFENIAYTQDICILIGGPTLFPGHLSSGPRLSPGPEVFVLSISQQFLKHMLLLMNILLNMLPIICLLQMLLLIQGFVMEMLKEVSSLPMDLLFAAA